MASHPLGSGLAVSLSPPMTHSRLRYPGLAQRHYARSGTAPPSFPLLISGSFARLLVWNWPKFPPRSYVANSFPLRTCSNILGTSNRWLRVSQVVSASLRLATPIWPKPRKPDRWPYPHE
ncbi:hypothetical protein CBS76997_7945 [Aspergillus niger]|nr:hypothetical protein CBS13152_3940 [Aspergillus niger]KAI3039358.1 hypothetical protein CBS76997_7945 [Aspergillus niger]